MRIHRALGGQAYFQIVYIESNSAWWAKVTILDVNGHPIPDDYKILTRDTNDTSQMIVRPGFPVRDDVTLDDFVLVWVS
jgi:hypothetical protein